MGIYYSGSHKIRGNVHVLFCVTTLHTSGHTRNRGVTHKKGLDAHNTGVMLITRAVTLVSWPVTLVTRSYIRKMAVKLLDRTLLERVGLRQGS